MFDIFCRESDEVECIQIQYPVSLLDPLPMSTVKGKLQRLKKLLALSILRFSTRHITSVVLTTNTTYAHIVSGDGELAYELDDIFEQVSNDYDYNQNTAWYSALTGKVPVYKLSDSTEDTLTKQFIDYDLYTLNKTLMSMEYKDVSIDSFVGEFAANLEASSPARH